MINDEDKKKIRLMTRIAIYEKEEGKKNEPVAGYFRTDYIGQKILGAIVSATLTYAIVVGLYFVCNSETLLINVYQIDLMEMARKLVLYYIGFLSAYIVIIAIAFFARYSKAIRYKRIFSRNLKKLLSHYRNDEVDEDGYGDE